MNSYEENLVKGCIAGDNVSQFGLYRLYGSRMLGVCLRYVRTREDAEDILHEGFLKVFKCIHQFDGRGSLEGWIRVIMINCSLTRFRKDLHAPHFSDLDVKCKLPAEEIDMLSNLSVKEMLNIIQSLSPIYRLVFNLYVFEGYKHREISQMLNISEGTSKSNFFDAKAIIKKKLLKKFSYLGISK